MKKYLAELFGTMVLVLFGCGTAVVTGGSAGVAGVVGISLAFGLSIVAMAYAIGPVSGCHVNPAVSIGLWVSKRLSTKDMIGYVVAQFIGATIGAAILYLIVTHSSLPFGMGTNGYGALSAAGVSMWTAFGIEVILTAVFVYVILVVTSKEATANIAGLVIGLTLVLIHLLGIMLTGTSVNPARSFGPALFMGGEALSQVWVFIAAPLLGGICAAVIYKVLNAEKAAQ